MGRHRQHFNRSFVEIKVTNNRISSFIKCEVRNMPEDFTVSRLNGERPSSHCAYFRNLLNYTFTYNYCKAQVHYHGNAGGILHYNHQMHSIVEISVTV